MVMTLGETSLLRQSKGSELWITERLWITLQWPVAGVVRSRDQEERAELEAEEDDAVLALDFDSEEDGAESDVDLPFEAGSDLPLELDSLDPAEAGPDWADPAGAELLARLSVR